MLLVYRKKTKRGGSACSAAEEAEPEDEDGVVATSPGAAGQLTGAKDGACQEP